MTSACSHRSYDECAREHTQQTHTCFQVRFVTHKEDDTSWKYTLRQAWWLSQHSGNWGERIKSSRTKGRGQIGIGSPSRVLFESNNQNHHLCKFFICSSLNGECRFSNNETCIHFPEPSVAHHLWHLPWKDVSQGFSSEPAAQGKCSGPMLLEVHTHPFGSSLG